MMKLLRGLLWLAVSILMFSVQPVLAQQNEQTGVVEELNQDHGSVTVSGRVLGYTENVSEIYIGDRRVGAETLDTGMVVRYILDAESIIQRMVIIGPADKLRLLEQN